MNIDTILLDLEVIKQINEYDKLSVINLVGSTRLAVDSCKYTSSITRYYYNFNRETTITYLENLTSNIEKTAEFLINGDHSEECETINDALLSALKGLTNLKITYNTDSIIVAKLTLIINKFKTVSKKLDNCLTNTANYINDYDSSSTSNSETSNAENK
uniref:Uncharacterized protein n=1 Tax=viral metagenome TaxID=1070528 RepID=A0A6C0DX69_9ZZZZ